VGEEIVKELKKRNWQPNQTNRFTFGKFLEKVKEEMNIAENIELAPHTLRRCFATYQAISGMPLPVLQKVLGHSKVSTTALYIRDGDLGNLVRFRPV
jgi:site-specific recombinase XerD